MPLQAEIPIPSGPGQKRKPRPNTYALKACERCRNRKQRCLVESDDDERNCADSGSHCMFLPRQDRSKRSRSERYDSEVSQEVDWSGQDHAQPTLSQSLPTTSRIPHADLFLTGRSTNELPDWNRSEQTQASYPQPTQVEWNALFTTLTQQATKMANTRTSDPPHPPTVQPSIAFQSREDRPIVSPTHESQTTTVYETAKGLAMISLEATAEPHYVGESHGSLWTTVISKGMHAPKLSNVSSKGRPHPTTRSTSPSRLTILRAQLLKPLSEEVAQMVLETVYRHLHSRYPFMDWLAFGKQWQARDEILLAAAQDRIHDKETGVAAYFILMILAIGAQYCKAQSPHGLLDMYDYYLLAQPYLSWIVQLHNLANVQGLLLLAIYSLRDTRGPSIWYISGLTIRLSISLGLHRASTLRNTNAYVAEMRKRIFWTCYTLDRMVSLLLGRPPGISDDDIDAELPIVESAPGVARSMASAVHYIKLKQLESKIQRAVFTIGRRQNMTAMDVYPFLQAIDQWVNEIPPESESDQQWAVPCCSRDWFLLRAVETKLHLLRPLCQDEGDLAQTFIPQLAQVAAEGCELQKRTHLLGTPTSNSQLYSTFICGLALLYAVFLQPSVLPLRELFSAVKAASNTLFAYSNHTSNAGPLFEVFEELSGICIDKVSRNDPPPTEAAKEWQKASVEAANNLDSDTAAEYADLFRSLGIEVENEASSTEGLWDLSTLLSSG